MLRAEAARGVVVAVVVIIVEVVLLLLRETRGHGARRASRGWWSAGSLSSSSSGDRLSRLCPVGQACAVPCVRPVRRASVFPWSGLLAVGAGSRGWAAGAERDETRRDEGRVDGALEGRGTRHEAQGAKG
jgi:hypothetical protein